jgi:cyclic pyranopterin phosphate synthase
MSEFLVDRFGRRHNNLRISVTDRCNIRCRYCMPERVEFQPQSQLLTFEEIARFVRIASGLGVDKVRLTGGEPLVRRDLPSLVGMLAASPGIRDVGLTTNGVLLADQAQALYDAGLRRINVSLDTLDRAQFERITRRDEFDRVLAGLDAAARVGLGPIKINAVAARGATDVVGLARFCRERGFELRFIEFMPLESDRTWSRESVLTSAEILEMLSEAGLPAAPAEKSDPAAPADEYLYEDGGGRIGIIASVSRPFCGSCNRIRLTADGKLRNCLFALEELDVKGPLRSGASDEAIAAFVRRCVEEKWEGHQINSIHFIRPGRPMHAIGG